ncbi:MAG: hypothetical protein HOI49_11530 [Bacteroidetes bacterium]|jgi:glycerophosphoryl diester phosphodiesterase|nr:hypothetical protein [Bacteroidota bacterium]
MKRAFRFIIKCVLILLVSAIIVIYTVGEGWGERSNYNLLPESKYTFSHRGITIYYPENTQAAYDAALRAGLNALEIDVSQTADGRLMAFHDHNEEELLLTSKRVSEQNWDELKYTTIYKQGKPTGQHLLLIDSLFTLYPKTAFYLDMKVHGSKVANQIAAIIREHKAEKRTIVASSHITTIAHLRHHHPGIITCLEGFKSGHEWQYAFIPKRYKPDYLASFIQDIDEEHVVYLRAHDLMHRKITYGVNNNNVATANEWGIQNCIVDISDTTLIE